ncbi:MFS transporter [Nocardia sp. NEAU-G5]|uniref:MFS transporter n=1 Tax=Nocardia albiluteola TaxID=2842303 RepID=A0ABS6AQH9_9NOCA|nr:MFS transporter [Nocardia albiluteola]MBU3060277.1 MFS transporter [Nocardia albiluteola]
MTVDQLPRRAGRREWTALAVLILPLLLVSMDVSVLYFAVPFIARDLNPTATQQLWIFDIYGFVLAGLLLTMGAVGDRIGRRRLLLIGAAGFSAASFAAAYAPNAESLIAARGVLGIAGATLMPSTLALIRNIFAHDSDRAKAMAVWAGVMSGGVAIGPILSGALLQYFWWGSVFLINIPAMVLLLILAPLLLPEFRGARGGSFDGVSAILSLAAVMPAIYGIKEWAADGFTAARLACALAGSVIGVLFVRRQRRVPDSVLDASLFTQRAFTVSVAAQLLAMFALVGNAVFVTQYLQSVLGMSPFISALWSLAPAVLVGGAAPLAAVLAPKLGAGPVVAAGFIIAAAGFAVMATIGMHALIPILIGAGLLGAGLVIVMTLVTDLAVGTVTPERAGAASAVLETGGELGGALGIAILGSIGAAVYRHRVETAIPADLPARAAHTLRETLGGAAGVASELPARIGDPLLSAARVAFTDGLDTMAAVGAAVMLLAALACGLLLRRGRPAGPDSPTDQHL